MRQRLLAAIALLAVPVGAAEPTWTRAASAHFEVYTTSRENTAARTLAYFEDVRSFLDDFLRLPATSRPPTAVVVFDNDAAYAPYRVAPAAAAYFQPARDRDYIVIGRASDAEPVIIHEYTHLAFERLRVKYPVWLSEGLADFFSTLQPFADRVVLGRPPDRRVGTLASERLMPLPDLLAVTHDSPAYGADHTGLFYAESWALTHMLVAGERYQPRVDQWLALMAAGTSPEAAWRTVYGRTVDEVAQDLQRYIRRGFYRQLSAPPTRARARPVTPPATVPAFDVELLLADILAAGRGREARARAAYDALAAARPGDPRPEAGRGLLEARAGSTEDAVRWLTAAAAHGSTDAIAWAELGRLAGATDPDRADQAMARALALAPASAEVRVRAAAQHARRGRAADALATLAPLTTVPADLRFEFYQVIAAARRTQGEFQLAADAAAQVLDAARTPVEIAFARDFARQVSTPPGVTALVTGTLIEMDCLPDAPILTIQSPAGQVRLQLDDRRRVVIAGGGSVDLDCGRQQRAVTAGYDTGDAPPGTNGRLRYLDFR